MISSSYVLDPRRSIKKGTASALAGGWVHHSSSNMTTDQESPAPVPDGRLETRVAGSQEAIALAIGELVQGIQPYFPPETISWGSSDYQLVTLDCAWFFDEFILLRRSHRPSVPYFGAPWVEYRCIALSDVDAIEGFREHAGLSGLNPEEQ